MRRALLLFIPAIAAITIVAACGGSEDSTSTLTDTPTMNVKPEPPGSPGRDAGGHDATVGVSPSSSKDAPHYIDAGVHTDAALRAAPVEDAGAAPRSADAGPFNFDASAFGFDAAGLELDAGIFNFPDGAVFDIDAAAFRYDAAAFNLDGAALAVDAAELKLDAAEFSIDASLPSFDAAVFQLWIPGLGGL